MRIKESYNKSLLSVEMFRREPGRVDPDLQSFLSHGRSYLRVIVPVDIFILVGSDSSYSTSDGPKFPLREAISLNESKSLQLRHEPIVHSTGSVSQKISSVQRHS